MDNNNIYYQRNRERLLDQEKICTIIKLVRNKQNNIMKITEKDINGEHGKNWYRNMSEEDNQILK